MQGTLVNAAAIIAGALLGTLFGVYLPEKIRVTVMQGIGLGTLLIGFQMALGVENILLLLLSLVAGAITGEICSIQERLNSWGKALEKRFSSPGNDLFTKGFVTTTLLFCVGAMAIVGPLESGLTGEHSILYAKSLIDGVASIILSASFGVGVAFSALSVFLYQGSITLLAGWLNTYLTETVIAEVTATGGLLIVGIGLNILEIKEIKVGNLLPALLYAFLLALLWG